MPEANSDGADATASGIHLRLLKPAELFSFGLWLAVSWTPKICKIMRCLALFEVVAHCFTYFYGPGWGSVSSFRFVFRS